MKLGPIILLSVCMGLLVGSASAAWVERPSDLQDPDYAQTRDYVEPVCPPGLNPQFFGVIVDGGVSKPIYVCLSIANGGKVTWADLQAEPTPSPG